VRGAAWTWLPETGARWARILSLQNSSRGFNPKAAKSERGWRIKAEVRVLTAQYCEDKKTTNGTMKTSKTVGRLVAGCLFACCLTLKLQAQTNLQFTAVAQTDEHAIQLTWASTNGELYQIQYANALATNSDGSTAWQTLYDNYPSQGTNTFWLDTGNYNLAPQALHPKYMSMRFYRILDEGQDSLTDVPTVTIDTLTNNMAATGELTFTVTAATDQPGLRGTILYVDGQEMQGADSVTNYTIGATNYETDTYSINTCEWLNRTHVLFATTEAASQYSSQENGGAVLTGHGVSPFVSVLFSNLVEGISFSQPSFDPSSGQTQQVSAVFANNSDWTLNIVDVYSNVVQTASGSGTSMSYNWDGTDNGTNLPNGLYYYYISAETNGESSDVMLSGGSSSFARSSAVRSESSELWAVAPDSENVVPFALYPPGFDTNGFTIFSATPSEVESLTASARPESSVAMRSGVSFAADSGGGSSASSQNSPPSPQRPPNNPVRGLAGTIGVAADTYTANSTNGPSVGPLDNGLGIHLYISMQDGSTAARTNPPRPQHKTEASSFVKTMQFYGWNNPLNKIDSQLSIYDLRGSGTPFNNVNMGVLMLHGSYGSGSSAIDYAANGCKQMYFTVTSGGSAQYLRFSEMNLGGSGTNGLKWMVMDACFSLYHANWSSMQSKGIYPYNSNLHLILGAQTETWASPRKWENFAHYMNYGTSILAGHYSPLTIRNAYYQANQDAFHGAQLPSGTTITLAVVGTSACLDDSLQTTNTPSGSWEWTSQSVYP
jgi:hypothetical protein